MKRTLLLPLNLAAMLLLLQIAAPVHAAQTPAAPVVDASAAAPQQPILIAWDRVGITAITLT